MSGLGARALQKPTQAIDRIPVEVEDMVQVRRDGFRVCIWRVEIWSGTDQVCKYLVRLPGATVRIRDILARIVAMFLGPE